MNSPAKLLRTTFLRKRTTYSHLPESPPASNRDTKFLTIGPSVIVSSMTDDYAPKVADLYSFAGHGSEQVGYDL